MSFISNMTNAICGGADILRVIKFVWILLKVVFWIVPMALILMISIDFTKNVMAGKEDDMRKNVSLVVKRIIYCILLFLIMPICEFVIGLVSSETKIDAWVENGKEIGWAECIEIAVNADDFDAYEINWDAENNSDNENDKGEHVTNGTLMK